MYERPSRFRERNKLLTFWSAHLDGSLYRVRMAHKALRRPADLRAIDGAFSGSIDTAKLVALRVRSMPEPDCSRPIRSAPEAPERSHASRVHLQNLDNPARTVHLQPAPPNSGTKHLGRWTRIPCDHGDPWDL